MHVKAPYMVSLHCYRCHSTILSAAAMQLLLLLFLLSSSPLSLSHTTTTTAAAAAPPASLTALMSKKGCKLFADLLSATPDVQKTFQDNVGSGLTVFCPSDSAVRSFAPKFKNLTADAKVSLLLYQAIPVYNSMPMLRSGNGVANTLATTTNNYNFTVQNEGEVVTLSTGIAKAAITATVVDADPLAVFTIDEVLEPRELFKPAAGPAPAPAPAPAAEPPAAPHHKVAKSPPAPTPAGPESEPVADRKPADDNAGAAAIMAARWAAAAATVAVLMVA